MTLSAISVFLYLNENSFFTHLLHPAFTRWWQICMSKRKNPILHLLVLPQSFLSFWIKSSHFLKAPEKTNQNKIEKIFFLFFTKLCECWMMTRWRNAEICQYREKVCWNQNNFYLWSVLASMLVWHLLLILIQLFSLLHSSNCFVMKSCKVERILLWAWIWFH